MTYEETLQFMFAQLPMYQRVGNQAFKKSLANIIEFCAFLGNPQDKFKTLHVAGTNGKGSSSYMLSAVLQAAGYQTGLYTSPHLKSFTERIRINGIEIEKAAVVDFIADAKPFIERVKPSFFEMTVAMAFHYFAQKKVDYAVIEVGLGGRLDSTNIIHPEVCLITNISLDHTNMLGNTLPEIAGEKAGIIKENIPVIVSEHQDAVAAVFEHHAQQKNAALQFASQQFTWKNQDLWRRDELFYESFYPHLLGKHQQANVIGVVATALSLGIEKATIRKGIEAMANFIQFTGRWQQLGENPAIFCDVGHNEAGVAVVLEQLAHQHFEQLHIVWGMVNDKAHQKILKMLPKTAHYYFCKPNVPRGMDAQDLAEVATNLGLVGTVHVSVNEAIESAKLTASTRDLIFIGGSTFVVAEVNDL